MSVSRTEKRGTEIVKFVSDPAQIRVLRRHLEELTNGEAFQASPRSQQFLRYIIEKSIRGDFESLKERVIGVELFQRPASFDTGEDSIVRVTASDVRKRLLQHYGRYGQESGIRLAIPSGSYIPEVTWTPSEPTVPQPEPIEIPKADSVQHIEPRIEEQSLNESRSGQFLFSLRAKLLSIFVALLLLASAFWLGYYVQKQQVLTARQSVLPWSVFLHPGHTLQIIASDPDFATEQSLTNNSASLADYGNGNYIPEAAPISPELRAFCLKYLRGFKSADIDVPIAANITSFAKPAAEQISIRPARALRLRDFHTDDDFVLLGSPVSNPWSDLFRDQLDFRFASGKGTAPESIENVHPQGKESALYSPNVTEFSSTQPSTGTEFAIVAFVGNPNQSGQVLLIAGTGPEGTEAAGRLVTNMPKLSIALRGCNIDPRGPSQHFEMLLKIGIMNGSFSSSDVIACHLLPAPKSNP
jgi:hypothetical protein